MRSVKQSEKKGDGNERGGNLNWKSTGVVYRIVTVVSKSGMLKDRNYDVTPYIIAHIYLQIRKGSAKSTRWEPEVIGTVSDRNRK